MGRFSSRCAGAVRRIGAQPRPAAGDPARCGLRRHAAPPVRIGISVERERKVRALACFVDWLNEDDEEHVAMRFNRFAESWEPMDEATRFAFIDEAWAALMADAPLAVIKSWQLRRLASRAA
jgi:hypothetical protein